MLYMAIHNLKAMLCMYKKRGILLLAIPIIFAIINPKNGFFPLYMLMGATMILAAPEIENRDSVWMTILSAPVKRGEYVYSRFIAIVIWIIFTVVTGLGLNYVLHLFLAEIPMVEIAALKIIPPAIIVLLSIYTLIFFLFGEKAAKIAYYVLFFGVIYSFTAFRLTSIKKLADIIPFFASIVYENSMISYALYIIIILAAISIFAVVSAVVYDKKDL